MDAQDVKIVDTEKPIPVTLEKGDSKLVTKESRQTLAPTTTEEQDTVTAGQRKVNLIWEKTQRAIAIFSVFAGILTNAVVIAVVLIVSNQLDVNRLAIVSMCLQFINLTAGIIIGFYFSRTNHQKTGGVGANQEGR